MNGIIFCVGLTLAKSHSKVEANDEFGLAMQRKGSRFILYCITEPGEKKYESQSPLSLQAEQYDRTARPVVWSQHADRFTVENDETNSYAEAESELSLGSRSFLHRVNDQVRKRQKQSSKDATQDSDKHSVTWECLCLQRCKHLYSWERITWKIYIPSKIQKISQ